MIFDLVHDFSAVLEAIPAEHPTRRILALLDEALRRDVHFIDRNPTMLFQCLWNAGWWHDCTVEGDSLAAASRSVSLRTSAETELIGGPLSELVDRWHQETEQSARGRYWLQALCRPTAGLESGVLCSIGSQQGPEIRQVAIHGLHLVTAHNPGPVRRWDIRTGREINEVGFHYHWASCVAFSPDGRWVASGGGDWQLRLWNATGGEIWHNGMEGAVTSVRFSPDGGRVAVASGEAHDSKNQVAKLSLLDVKDGSELACIRQPRDAQISDLQYSSDGKTLFGVFHYARTEAVAWNAADLKELARVSLGEDSVSNLHVAPDGRMVAAGFYNGAVTLNVFDDANPLVELRPPGAQILSLRFSHDGKRLAVSDRDGGLRIFDVAARREALSALPPANVEILDYEDDSRLLLVAYDEGAATLYRFDVTRAKPGPLRASTRGGHLALALDEDRVCIVLKQSVTLWETATGRFVAELKGHTGDVRLVVSPDQRRLATLARDDPRIGLWEAATGNFIRWIEGFAYAPEQFTFSAQGELAVTAAFEEVSVQSVRVWDAIQWSVMATISAPPGSLGRVAICGESGRIAMPIVQHNAETWTNRSVIFIWGRPWQSAPAVLIYNEGQFSVRDITFRSSGSRLVVDGGAGAKAWVYEGQWRTDAVSAADSKWASDSRYPWISAAEAVADNAFAAHIHEDMTRWLPDAKASIFSLKHRMCVVFSNRELQFYRLRQFDDDIVTQAGT